MPFSVVIFAVRSAFLESKNFCASSTPADGLGADSTFLTNSVVKESRSVTIELISASFLQPQSGRQASSSTRIVNRLSIGGLHSWIVKRYHLSCRRKESQGKLLVGTASVSSETLSHSQLASAR